MQPYNTHQLQLSGLFYLNSQILTWKVLKQLKLKCMHMTKVQFKVVVGAGLE